MLVASDSPSLSQQEIRTYASLDKVAIKGPDQAEECHFTSPLDQKLFKQYGATHQLNDMPNEVPMNHKLPPKPCRASRLPIFPNKHYARVFKN